MKPKRKTVAAVVADYAKRYSPKVGAELKRLAGRKKYLTLTQEIKILDKLFPARTPEKGTPVPIGTHSRVAGRFVRRQH